MPLTASSLNYIQSLKKWNDESREEAQIHFYHPSICVPRINASLRESEWLHLSVFIGLGWPRSRWPFWVRTKGNFAGDEPNVHPTSWFIFRQQMMHSWASFKGWNWTSFSTNSAWIGIFQLVSIELQPNATNCHPKSSNTESLMHLPHLMHVLHHQFMCYQRVVSH